MRGKERRTSILSILLLSISFLLLPLSSYAQTKIKAPRNFFGIKTDIQAGREEAVETEQKAKILRDREVTDYVNRIGQRLVASIPPEFQHSEFRYTFKVIDDKDINAFALPGGFVYVNRGMIEAARNEGEFSGVMAHVISYVAVGVGTGPWRDGYSL